MKYNYTREYGRNNPYEKGRVTERECDRLLTDSQPKGSPSTKVVHCKKESYDVYIGRPSKWGNPFTIGVDGTREEVIQKYKGYIITQPDLLNSLDELKGKVLGCWCSPKECHGDVLIKLSG